MEDIKHKDNFIVKFAKGGYSLPLSFWAFGFSVQMAFYILGSVVSSLFSKSSGFKGIFIILIFFEIATKIWLLVGIWNSGKFYKGSMAWVVLSRIAIILLFGITILEYIFIISALTN